MSSRIPDIRQVRFARYLVFDYPANLLSGTSLVLPCQSVPFTVKTPCVKYFRKIFTFRGSPSPLKFTRFLQNCSIDECIFFLNLLCKGMSVWVHFHQDEEHYDLQRLQEWYTGFGNRINLGFNPQVDHRENFSAWCSASKPAKCLVLCLHV